MAERLLRTFLTAWDPHREVFSTLVRTTLGGGDTEAPMLQLARNVLITSLLDVLEGDDRELRATLIAGQLIGMATLRYVVELDPLADAPIEDVVAPLRTVDAAADRLTAAQRTDAREPIAVNRATTIEIGTSHSDGDRDRDGGADLGRDEVAGAGQVTDALDPAPRHAHAAPHAAQSRQHPPASAAGDLRQGGARLVDLAAEAHRDAELGGQRRGLLDRSQDPLPTELRTSSETAAMSSPTTSPIVRPAPSALTASSSVAAMNGIGAMSSSSVGMRSTRTASTMTDVARWATSPVCPSTRAAMSSTPRLARAPHDTPTPHATTVGAGD